MYILPKPINNVEKVLEKVNKPADKGDLENINLLEFENGFGKVPHKILLREIHNHSIMDEVFVKGQNKELPLRTERG